MELLSSKLYITSEHIAIIGTSNSTQTHFVLMTFCKKHSMELWFQSASMTMVIQARPLLIHMHIIGFNAIVENTCATMLQLFGNQFTYKAKNLTYIDFLQLMIQKKTI